MSRTPSIGHHTGGVWHPGKPAHCLTCTPIPTRQTPPPALVQVIIDARLDAADLHPGDLPADYLAAISALTIGINSVLPELAESSIALRVLAEVLRGYADLIGSRVEETV